MNSETKARMLRTWRSLRNAKRGKPKRSTSRVRRFRIGTSEQLVIDEKTGFARVEKVGGVWKQVTGAVKIIRTANCHNSDQRKALYHYAAKLGIGLLGCEFNALDTPPGIAEGAMKLSSKATAYLAIGTPEAIALLCCHRYVTMCHAPMVGKEIGFCGRLERKKFKGKNDQEFENWDTLEAREEQGELEKAYSLADAYIKILKDEYDVEPADGDNTLREVACCWFLEKGEKLPDSLETLTAFAETVEWEE